MRRSVSIVGLAAALVLGTLGFGTDQKSYVASAQEKMSMMEVKIDNFTFGPATLTVPVGTTVTWTNKDDIPHTVVSTDDSKTFKSKVLDTDENLSILLFDSSEDDRQSHRAVSEERLAPV
jgi:plastocyanin